MEMYHHGISTLMLAEVMRHDRRQARQGAAAEAGKGRRAHPAGPGDRSRTCYQGGWRYTVPSHDADISVTGWQILALRAAKNLGCDVPAERIDRAVEFIKRCRDLSTRRLLLHAGRPGHASPAPAPASSPWSCAARNAATRREALQAGSYLLKHPLRWGDEHFFYATYYCSQAMFQLGNNYWNFYRPQLHKVLFDNQQPNGSWLDQHGPGLRHGDGGAGADGRVSLPADLPAPRRGGDAEEVSRRGL